MIDFHFFFQIWDLRRRQSVYTIPAHTNLISDVKYQKDGGNFLVTSSYDCSVKVKKKTYPQLFFTKIFNYVWPGNENSRKQNSKSSKKTIK